jgi:hypothetical protein
MILRFSSLLTDSKTSTANLETLESALNTSQLGTLAAGLVVDGQKRTKKARLKSVLNSSKLTNFQPNENELITVSLSSIFSILLELNHKDPALCAQALQSLLGLLQNLPPETFGAQSHSMITQMHNLLKALRLEGMI